MSNILEVSQQQVIQALIVRNWSIRRIARTLGVNRRTVQRYADAAASKCTQRGKHRSMHSIAIWGPGPARVIASTALT